MRKILKFNGTLNSIMKSDAKATWLDDLGLLFRQGHQTEDGLITLMEVIDETKAVGYMNHQLVDVLTVEQANVVVDSLNRIAFICYDSALYGANISVKIESGTLDLDELDPTWNNQEELEFLYNKGISGISKTEIKPERY